MADSLFRVCLGGYQIEAASEEDAACLKGLPTGALVRVKVERPRRAERLRFYWGMMAWVAEQLREAGHVQWDKDLVHEAVCLAAGHCVEAVRPDGEVIRKVKSIGFASMGEDEFIRFSSKAKDIILAQLLPAVMSGDEFVSHMRERGLLNELGEQFISRFC